MSYLASLRPRLFKNIAHVGSYLYFVFVVIVFVVIVFVVIVFVVIVFVIIVFAIAVYAVFVVRNPFVGKYLGFIWSGCL